MKKAILISLVAIAAVSCQKELKEVVYSNLTDENAFTTAENAQAGKKFLSDFDEGYWYLPHTSTFTATIEAPPACMAGGDSLVLHTTLNLDAKPNGWYLGESSSLNFDLEGVGMGAIHVSARRGQVRNLVGSTNVCTRYGSPHSGEWDFVIYIPNGSKDQLKALNFSSCGSRTHWVYKWCTVFEKDE